MSKTIGRVAREGTVSFGDASLSVLEESIPSRSGVDGIKARDALEQAFKREVFARIVQTLNRLGWTVEKPPINPHDVKHYGGTVARWASERHRNCSKGDLKGELEVMGRCIKFEMWQGVNTPTRPDHGGRYENDKEGCMPYLLRLEMERTRRRIRDYLLAVFTGYTFDEERRSVYRRPLAQTAMEKIQESYARSWHFKGDMADYLCRSGYDQLPSYNCTSLDGDRIEHGQRVWFRDYVGRVCEGVAYYNINNMWWVVTGRYDASNVSTSEIWTKCPPNPRVKRNARQRRKRLEQLLADATKAMDFERAMVLRDLLFPKGEQLYVIKSDQGNWWGPDGCGYRKDIADAGKYTADEARRVLGPTMRASRGDYAIAITF